jgi:hypothetical protein
VVAAVTVPPRWNVKAQANTGSAFGWITYADRLSYDIALETAQVIGRLHPEWQWRLVDETTGEVTHLEDGKPVEAEQVQA